MPDSTELLQVVGVTAGYGATMVLRDVSVGVKQGEVMALLGRRDEARDLIRDIIGKNGAKNLGLYAPYAQVMALTGEYPHARPEVAAAVRRSNNASTSWRLVAAMQHLDGSTLSADTRCAYSYAGQRFGAPPPAVATIPDPVGCASAG